MGVTVQFRGLLFVICLLLSVAGTVCFFATDSQAVDEYTNSAHGSTAYGVDSVVTGFTKANCAHCHVQHESVLTGAKDYLLFDDSNSGQGTNFCFNCHTSVGSYQTVTNRSYSYRAGGWTTELLNNNIKSAFAQNSSHNLADIVTFAAGDPTPGWKYTDKSNACAVCHDPHVVQGDPAANTTGLKASGATKGWVITEVDSVSLPVNLWGDDVGEKINASNNYLAPWRVLSSSYEPDGDAISDGSNLPDYIAFCTKCHDGSNAVYSTERAGNLKVIDWSATGDIHGKQNAVDISMLGTGPYPTATLTSYVLSCLDCHEPHGSGNIYLLRGKVNGQVTGTIASGIDFDKICRQCHDPNVSGTNADWEDEHHTGGGAPYQTLVPGSCDSPLGCHDSGAGGNKIICSSCHYHGAVAGSGTPLVPDTTPTASGITIF